MSRKGWNLQASLTSASDHRKWWALSRHQVSTPTCTVGGCDPMAWLTFHGRFFLLFGFFLLTVSFWLPCFPRGFSVFPVTSKPSSSSSPWHARCYNATTHRPQPNTHVHTDVCNVRELAKKDRPVHSRLRTCVCVASVRLSKSSEGTNATQVSSSEGVFCKRRLPLHRNFLGFLVCSQSGDHPWKPFFFFFLFGNCVMLLKWRSSMESSSGLYIFSLFLV